MIGEWNGSTVARLTLIMMMFCFNLRAEEIRFLTGSLSNGLSISFRSWVNQFQVMRHENSYCSIHYTYYSIMVKLKKMVVGQDFHTYLNNLCRVKKSDLFAFTNHFFFLRKNGFQKSWQKIFSCTTFHAGDDRPPQSNARNGIWKYVLCMSAVYVNYMGSNPAFGRRRRKGQNVFCIYEPWLRIDFHF